MISRAPRYEYVLPIEFRPSAEFAWTEGRMVNASRTGILFRSPVQLEPGTDLDVRFRLRDSAEMKCRCRVVRQAQRDRELLVGICILRSQFGGEIDIPETNCG